MTQDNRHLSDVRLNLKEAWDGPVAKVVEAKVRQASTVPKPLPRQPENEQAHIPIWIGLMLISFKPPELP